MTDDGKDGAYCSICGGIPPDRITIRRIPIAGKETGIDRLDWIFSEVANLGLSDETEVSAELLRLVQKFNYIPARKSAEYAEGLLAAYKNRD
ncbi:MAG: hypothetical protein METHP_01818 [Methanoregula sp. SKADARSKE-2]|nr:MAG: hypothetical protein METHP_01818 [Methanoregula sp. SKADARSKE-2]